MYEKEKDRNRDCMHAKGEGGGRECGEKEERMVNGIFGRGKNMNKEKWPWRSVI